MMTRTRLTVLAAGVAIALTGCPPEPETYKAETVPLKAFPGALLNNHGEIAGIHTEDVLEDGVPAVGIWKDGVFTPLDAPEDTEVQINHFNDTGIVVGRLGPRADSPLHLWGEPRGEGKTVLPPPPHHALSHIFGLNNHGDMTGWAPDPIENGSGFIQGKPMRIWADGEAEELPEFEAPEDKEYTYRSRPTGINDEGVVAGTALANLVDSGEMYPLVWNAGGLIELSTGPRRFGRTADLNNEGWIVGAVHDGGSFGFGPPALDDGLAAVWRPDGILHTLRRDGWNLRGTPGITNGNSVLTIYQTPTGEQPVQFKTVVWEWDPVAETFAPYNVAEGTDLEDAEDLSFIGIDINDAGQILARVSEPGSEEWRLYLLTPAE